MDSNLLLKESQCNLRKEAIASPIKSVLLTTRVTVHHNESFLETSCIFSRGPWIESAVVQLSPLRDSQIFLGELQRSPEDESHSQQRNVTTDSGFRHLVFDMGGSIHGIRKVFGLRYVHPSHNQLESVPVQRETWCVFGGRQLTLVSGGLSYPFHSFRFQNSNNLCNTSSSHILLSDWIWDVRPLELDSDPHERLGGPILLAVSLAHNAVDLWFIRTIQNADSSSVLLVASRLQKIICESRSLTLCNYFCGWDATTFHRFNLSLSVMVGTPSNQLLLWNVLDEKEAQDLVHMVSIQSQESSNFQTVLRPVQHRLSGHDGVIFSVSTTWVGSHQYIATVSDDRTLRLWKGIQQEDKTIFYQQMWTGYGHTARVWDCAFVSHIYPTSPLIVLLTCGEDNAIRVWNMEDGTILAVMHGHHCESIWKIGVNEWFEFQLSLDSASLRPLVVSAGNDGTVKCWDLYQQITQFTTDGNLPCVCTIPTDKIENIKIQQDATVCGIQFYPKTLGHLLVATRDGQLRSIDYHSGSWRYHHPWARNKHTLVSCEASKERSDTVSTDYVDPAHGCCLSVHPHENIAVVGTTKGEVVVSSLMSNDVPINISLAKSYMSIQNVYWVDDQTLLSCHIKGVAILWMFCKIDELPDIRINKPNIFRILIITIPGVTVGVPMCFARDFSKTLFFLGDSRGNIAAFSLTNDLERSASARCYPTATAPFSHGKEHIRDLVIVEPNTLLSVGNDGCIHSSTFWHDGSKVMLQKLFSIPVSNLTALTNIWVGSHRRILVGGFHGNDFSIWDSTTTYRLLTIPFGGRQRPYDLHIEQQTLFPCIKYQLVIYANNKEVPSELLFYFSKYSLDASTIIPRSYQQPFHYSIGTCCHGDTILDIATLQSKHKQDTLYFVTGSNNGSLRLSEYIGGTIAMLKELPKHETCIRAICFSQHFHSTSALLVVCGGKDSIALYVLQEIHTSIVVQFIGRNRSLQGKTQDHRINAVKATPLFYSQAVGPSDSEQYINYHFIVAGNSDGAIYVMVVNECQKQMGVYHRIAGEENRPILSIDLSRLSSKTILCAVGRTSGEVELLLFPGQLSLTSNTLIDQMPTSSFFKYSAHQMGTNTIKVVISGKEVRDTSNISVNVIIISGGDDQSICITKLNMLVHEEKRSAPNIVSILITSREVVDGASSSAIKGLFISEHPNQLLAYVVGYSEILTVWEVDNQAKQLSSIQVDVSDIECIGGNSNAKDTIIVGGHGLEAFSVDVASTMGKHH